MTDDGPDDPTGQVLSGGHYRLGPPLTPAVRSARDEWEGRDVVAVALAPDGGTAGAGDGGDGGGAGVGGGGGGGGGALTRVARDARRIAEHPHPGLAPVRDVAAGTDRTLWLVHDVPAGARGLADADAVPARVLLGRALTLAGALAAAHAARVVHGRVGPDVVLVGRAENEVWLLGAASGVRPADRPAAEDDDTRALAAALAAVPLTSTGRDADLAPRVTAVLAGIAGAPAEGAGASGRLDARLRRELRALRQAAEPDPEPDADDAGPAMSAERPTARVDLAPPAGGPVLVPAGPGSPAGAAAPAPARARPSVPGPPPDARPGPAPNPSPGPPPPRGAPRGPGAGPGPGDPHAPAPPRRDGPATPGVPAPPRPRAGSGGPPVGPPAGPSRPPSATLVLLAVGAVVLLLAGAVVAIAVLGGEDTPAGPQDRVVPPVIGDARTVDPCGLVDPAALAPAAGGGDARVVPDLGSPAACTVDVAGARGDVVLVATLEPVATTVTASAEQRVGPLLVRRVPPRPGLCTRTVVTTEGVQVALDALVPAGSGADPCPVADAATDGAVAALQRGTTLPRRVTDDPPGALTGVDACAVLAPGDLAVVPGLDPTRVAPGVGGWSCRWGTGTGAGPVVSANVERRRTVAPTEDLAGRAALVTPGQDVCTAAVVQRAHTATDGSPRVELLAVGVRGARSSEALCAHARTLVTATVPRLPPPWR